MPVINGLAVEHRRGLNLHVWEWRTDSGTTHQIVWSTGSHVLLYRVRPAGADRWTDRHGPRPLAGARRHLASVRRQVTELLTAATGTD